MRNLLVVVSLALAGMALPIASHPGNQDVNAPHSWNTFAGNGQTAGSDGLQDLWDPDGNGVRNLQFDRAAFQASVGEHDYGPPATGATMLRQPVDYESPGLIFWSQTHDSDRRGAPYDPCAMGSGALHGPHPCGGADLDPQVPYRSALHYHDLDLGLAYQGASTGNPCNQGPPPMSIPIIVVPVVNQPVLPTHERPDNPPPDNVEPGSLGDELGETPYYQDDVYGLFDALENLQTTPLSHALPWADFRYHILRNSLKNATDGMGPQAPESYYEDIGGPPDGVMVSPGHDGFIFGRFQYPIVDGPGPDVRVYESHGIPYCLFGAAQQDGPYYLIGTSYGEPGGGTFGPNEDFDLSRYYNAPGAVDKGGPVVQYFGIVTTTHPMHRLTADFSWTPNVPPAYDADGQPERPIGKPVEPVRNQDITFIDRSSRHGGPYFAQDPVAAYRWTFNDPNACNGSLSTSPGCYFPPDPPPDPRDLNWSHAKEPVHRFEEPGVYNVCYTAITRQGWTDTVCKDVDVWNYDPVVTIYATRVDGCVPDLWRLHAEATDPEGDNITSWTWTLSDGSTLLGQSVTHAFAAHGSYLATLTAVDEYGGIGTKTIVIATHSRDNHPPILQKIPPRIVTPGTTVEFVIEAFDPDCDTLEYAYYGLPEDSLLVSTDPITFRWVPTEVGLYDGIHYQAADGLHRVNDTTWVRVVPNTIDEDGDGAGANVADNCPGVPNHGQEDADGDGIGDACEALPAYVRIDGATGRTNDLDGDGIADASDNCIVVANPDQFDLDLDGLGDLCDVDLDGDGIVQTSSEPGVILDNCAFQSNPGQQDEDGDGSGDECDVTVSALAAGACADCGDVRPVDVQARHKAAPPVSAWAVAAVVVATLAVLAAVLLLGEGVRMQRRR